VAAATSHVIGVREGKVHGVVVGDVLVALHGRLELVDVVLDLVELLA